jgi:hypothetical protein
LGLTFVCGLFTASTASASLSQCPANAVCAWSGSGYLGTFSWWSASDTGCHDHTNNPQLRSFYNNTSSKTVQLGGAGSIGPGAAVTDPVGSPITGLICW